MKINRLLLVLLVSVALLSCKKEHYDVTNVHGVNAEGELLLPIANKTFTMMDMMERFQIDSLIECSESGDLSYNYYFENYDAISGYKLLKFNDLSHTEHYAFPNPFGSVMPPIIDTVLRFERTIRFEADHIRVMNAVMRSGRFEFKMVSNVGNLQRVVLRSSDIKDASGRDFVFDSDVQANSFGFDLDDLNYRTDTANTLTFSYELYCYFSPTNDPELFVDLNIVGYDLAMKSMCGFVDSYSSRNSIDTVFSLFPGNVEGFLELEGVSMRLSERNTFPLDARLVVDTAMVIADGIEPYSILEPLPLVVELPMQNDFAEVFSQPVNGRINASGGRTYASSEFIVNAQGIDEMVTIEEMSCVDVKVDVEIPFDFKIDEVTYVDTADMNLSELDMPDMIERITLELTFTSTLPLNLNGQFYMYDSENDVITDVLISDAQLIQASFDGQPTTSTVIIDVTEERIEHVLHSDRIIMAYKLDTDAHNVKLNANQSLNLFVKAKVKYNLDVELKID